MYHRRWAAWTSAALAVALVLGLALAIGAVGVGAAQSVPENETVGPQSGYEVDGVEVGPRVANAEGTTTVVVRLTEAHRDPAVAVESTEGLQRYAERTQRPIERFARSTRGVEVRRGFWLTNAVLVEVDVDEVSVDRLARVEHVERIHDNFEVEALGAAAASPPSGASGLDASDAAASEAVQSDRGEYTYGLELVNAPETWETFGTRGEGVSVAVLDTGVDPTHPDIDLDPDNWAQFDDDGSQVDVPPNAVSDHGTHVAGTIFGGNASGTHIGVAPEATHYHANVIPGGSGNFTGVIAGMEWAVEEDVDVISMSLGARTYREAYIDPIRNARANGTLVVAAIGNDRLHNSGSPGNVYDTLSVGGVDEDLEPYFLTSGESIDTDHVWGDDAPADWPEAYSVPNLVGPAVDVYSATLEDDGSRYREASGTSMATPHVSGTAALVLSASEEDLSPDELEAVLLETTADPEPGHRRDIVYGEGVVDALNATAAVTADTTVSGTVVDGSGDPVGGIPVESELGPRTVANEDGEFALEVPSVEQELVASFGFDEPGTATVDGADTDSVENVTLEVSGPQPTIEVVRDAPEYATAGESYDLRVRVANAQNYTALPSSASELDRGENTSVAIDGEDASWAEPLDLSDGPAVRTIDLEVTSDDDHVGTVMVVHFAPFGSSEQTALLTENTAITPETIEVPQDVDPDRLQHVVDVAPPYGAVALGDGRFDESYGGSFGYPSGRSTGVVLREPITITAQPGADPVIAARDPPDDEPADVIYVNARDVTVTNVTIDAGGGDVGFRATYHRGLIFEDNRVENATTAVWLGSDPDTDFDRMLPEPFDHDEVRPWDGRIDGNEFVDVEFGLRGENLFADSVSDNRVDAGVVGIQMDAHSNPILVANNEITVPADGYAPIALNDTSGLWYNNSLEGGQYGLLVANATIGENVIAANDVRNASRSGIVLRRSTRPTGLVVTPDWRLLPRTDDNLDSHRITANTIEDVGGDGILVNTTRETNLDNNTVRNAGGDGIELRRVTRANVEDTVVTDVNGSGVAARDAWSPFVHRTTIDGAARGIAGTDTFDLDVVNSSVANVSGPGIALANVNSSLVTNTDLVGGGIAATDGTRDVLVISSTITDATVAFRVRNASDVSAYSPTLQDVSSVLTATHGAHSSSIASPTVTDANATVTLGRTNASVEGLQYPDGSVVGFRGRNVTAGLGSPPTTEYSASDGVFVDVDVTGADPTLNGTVEVYSEAFGADDAGVYQYLPGDGAWAPVPFDQDGTIDAVTYEVGATGTVAVLDAEPDGLLDPANATLSVDAVDAPSAVEPDESYTATATVATDGAGVEDATVEYLVDGEVVGNATVDVPPAAETTVGFEHSIASEGEVEHAVRTRDDRLNLSLDVATAESGGGGGGGGSGGSGGGGGGGGGAVQPIDLAVSDVEVSEEAVEPGESVEVTLTVENVDERSGTRDLELADGLTVLDSTSLALTPGEQRRITFEGSLEEPGTYEFALDGEHVATIEVAEETDGGDGGSGDGTADLVVSASAPQTAAPDDDVSLEVAFENDGDAAGTGVYAVWIDGDQVDTDALDLDADERVTRRYDLDPDGDGAVDWRVTLDGETVASGTLDVEAVDGDDTNDAVDVGDGLPGFGIGAAIAALLAVAGAALRRRA